jgi:putative permease
VDKMTEAKRKKTLMNLGILTLSLVSLYYIDELFQTQLLVFRAAVNSIVLPFGIALFISYLVEPVMRLFEKHLKIKNKMVNVILVLVIMAIIGAGFLYYVGAIIYEQAVDFFENDWEGIVEWFNTTIEENETFQSTYESINDFVSFNNATPIIFNLMNVFRGIGSFVIIIVLIPVFLFFLLKEKETVFQGIVSILPRKYKTHVAELGKRSNVVIQKYFNGRFLVMLVLSVAFTIMFMVFGFDFQRSLFFGFVLGFLDIVPYIGGFIGLLLPILYSFTVSSELLMGQWTFLGLIAVNGVIQLLASNILQPIIMGKEVNLHPLLVLSSFIFFGSLFGVAGVILAIPITGIIKATAIYVNEQKNPTEQKASKEPDKLPKKALKKDAK